MQLLPENFDQLAANSVSEFWNTIQKQSNKNKLSLRQDVGSRGTVTGGQQLQGFCNLASAISQRLGFPEKAIFSGKKLELPGYFRPTKKWDLVMVHEGRLVAAMEFKSQRGPSFGNNFNNRTEEAIGSARDFWTASREKAYGDVSLTPWLGWMILVEDCPKSNKPVEVEEPHFEAFGDFQNASYIERYLLLGRRLRAEQLYAATGVIQSRADRGLKGEYRDVASDVGLRNFFASFAGHVAAYIAGHPK